MNENFGAFFKQKRLEKNLTQKELANMLYVSESAVSKWEKGVAHPDITLLPKLAEILGVTEHELITSSVDNDLRQKNKFAKRWKTLAFSWNLFFIISYLIAILVCFICNLAVNKTLSWFWIVFLSLALSFTITNLPKYIVKYKLIILPLSIVIALSLLLVFTCLYTDGKWAWVALIAIWTAFIMVFTPIYISKIKIFAPLKKINAYISLLLGTISLVVLLAEINEFALKNGYAKNGWFINLALPLTAIAYLVLNILISIKYIRINALFRASIIVFICGIIYFLPSLITTKWERVNNVLLEINVLKSNFSVWKGETISQNVHLIILITIFLTSIALFIGGLFYQKSQKI